MDAIPSDIYERIIQTMLDESPINLVNTRIVNREFKCYTDMSIQSRYEALALSAHGVSVLSSKARLKYTLQYIKCITDEQTKDVCCIKGDIFFMVFLTFILLC